MSKPAILCVDDEAMILNSVLRQLQNAFDHKYTYEAAENAEEALEIIEELQEENIQVIAIVSDWLMPGMKGDEFLVEAHKISPETIKILLTGQADEEAIERARQQADLYSYIPKPWSDRELIDCIKSGIETL
jgi:CheY-like chemotaxis protein